jgi:hypothetical protein
MSVLVVHPSDVSCVGVHGSNHGFMSFSVIDPNLFVFVWVFYLSEVFRQEVVIFDSK